MASESEQGHVGCTAKRRTRLARLAFVGRSVKSLTNSNRRIRNRTYGGVGGADERLSPLSRSRVSAPRHWVIGYRSLTLAAQYIACPKLTTDKLFFENQS